MAEPNGNGNGNGTTNRLLGSLALAAAIAALFIPLKDRIDSIMAELQATKSLLETHRNASGHAESDAKINAMQTSLDDIKRRVDLADRRSEEFGNQMNDYHRDNQVGIGRLDERLNHVENAKP